MLFDLGENILAYALSHNYFFVNNHLIYREDIAKKFAQQL